MTEKIWIAVISAIIGPIVAVQAKIAWDWWKRKKDGEQSEKKMGTYITYIDEIYILLEKLREKQNCSRAIILKAENGGGIPKEGHQIYSSILWETTDNETEAFGS